MLERNKRFVVLAVLMVLVSVAVSIITSIILYRAALSQQKRSLHELAQSQASLASEIITHYYDMEKKLGIPFNLKAVASIIANAQKQLETTEKEHDFIIGINSLNLLKFLVINGHVISDQNRIQDLLAKSRTTARMYKALKKKSETLIAREGQGEEIIAAYTPVHTADLSLGMVVKTNLDDVKKPFIAANAKTFTASFILILIGLYIFHKLSSPFIKTIENNEREYRTLVENADSLILKINSDGLISFANSFACGLLKPEEADLVGLSFLDIIDEKISSAQTDIRHVLNYFGDGPGPHERSCTSRKGEQIWIAWRIKATPGTEGNYEEILCIGNNITPKYIALEKLKASEARYKSIFENAPLGIVYFNRDGIISNCNDNLIDLLGSTRDKLIGFSRDEMLDLKMREALNKATSGENAIFENLYTSVTGKKTAFLRAIFSPVITLDPPFDVIGTLEDITQRKAVERELAKSEQRFKGIAKASPVGILITDASGNLQYVNCRTLQLFGTPVEVLEENGWTHVLHPKDKPVISERWYASSPITPDSLEFRIISRHGREIWVLGQIVVMEDTGNETPGFVITITDITPLKDAELEHKRLTAVIDQTAEAILITDTSGIITYVNPAFELISGFSAEEAVGRKPSIIRSGEHDTSFYADLWKTITRGEIWKGRFVNLSKDGRRFTQETTIAPVRDEEKKIVNYVSVARDITQQLRIEAQLRQAQKLESIGELAAGIAHEINTPTQYVTTNVKFLDDSFSDILDNLKQFNKIRMQVNSRASLDELEKSVSSLISEDELNYLEEDIPNAIRESMEGLRRIAAIVKSVKQLAHPGETHKSYHDINEIINDAVTVSTNEWKYVADMEKDLEENIPQLYCLKGEMGQVVLNLIINSAHAIEQSKDRSSDEKGNIKVKSYSDDESIILQISDTGCGMPRNVMERAFDPFFTTKKIGKGTGQGLAIAYNVIVNMHDGSIALDSKENVGTTVTIKLPLAEQQ